MFPVPVTLNFNLEWSNSTRYKIDKLIIKAQSLYLARNVSKKTLKKGVFNKSKQPFSVECALTSFKVAEQINSR